MDKKIEVSSNDNSEGLLQEDELQREEKILENTDEVVQSDQGEEKRSIKLEDLLNRMAFGERLRIQRELHHISEKSMAEKLGMELVSYHQLERGHNNPSLTKVLIIANELNISMDYLLVRKGDFAEKSEEKRVIIENIASKLSVCSTRNLERVSGIIDFYVQSLVNTGDDE